MANANLTIGGDPGGALAAIAAVQGALGGLTGKTVIVDVQTRGGSDASRALDSVSKSADGATSSYDRHMGAANRASDAVNRSSAANDRAASSARSSAAAHSSAADDVQRHGDAHGYASRNVDSMSNSLRAAQGEAGRTTKTFDDMWNSTNKGAGPDFLTGTGAFANLTSGAKTASEGVAQAAAGISHAGGSFGELGAGAERANRIMVDSSGAASRVSRDLAPVGSAARSSALELKDFGDGIYRASGGAQVAGREFSAFGRVIESAGGEGGGGGVIRRMTDGMSEFGAKASGALDSLEGKVGSSLGGVLPGVATGAVYATAAIGALDAAVVGMGVGASVLALRDMPGAMRAAASVGTSFKDGLKSIARTATDETVPAIRALRGPASELGKEVGRLGVDNMQTGLRDVAQIAGTATEAMKKLAPSVGPAENAFTTLASSVLTGLGNSGKAIDEFSNSINQNGPGLQNLTQSVTADAARAGSATVKTLASYGNAFPGGALLDDGPSQAYGVGQLIGDAVPALKKASDSVDSAIAPHLPNWAKTVLGVNQPDAISSIGSYGSYSAKDLSKMPQGTLSSGAATPLLPLASDSQGWMGPAPVGSGQAPPQTGSKTFDPSQLSPSQRAAAGLDKPLKAPQVGGGTSLGVETSQTRALTAAMNETSRAATGMGASSQQASRAVSASMQGAGQSAQQLPQHVGQAAQQIPSQVAQHAAQIPAAVAQPMAQVPKAAAAAIHPAAIAAPVQTAVQHVAAQAPQASDAGSDIGSSIGEGAQGGLTKTITKTLTLVENWVTNIIKTAAAGLDAHSPSRVFEGLGMSVGQGMELGLQRSAPLAVSATNQMISGMVGAGGAGLGGGGVVPAALSAGGPVMGSLSGSGGMLNSVLGGDGGSLSSASAQLNDHLGQLGQLGQSVAPNLQSTLLGPNGALGTLGKYTDGLQKAAGPQSAALRLMSDGNSQITGNPYSSGGGGKPQTDAQKKADADFYANQQHAFAKKGWTDATTDSVINRELAHNKRADSLREGAAINRDSALFRASHPGQAYSGDPKANATAWAALHPENSKYAPYADRDAQAKKDQQNASDAAARGASGSGGWRDAPGSVSDLFKSKGQAAAGADGRGTGQDFGDGAAEGLDSKKGKVQTSAAAAVDAINESARKRAGINSPSTVWAGYGGDLVAGMTGGMSDALSGASSGVSGIADNTGLQVGFLWARGVQDGIQRQFKSADFQSDAVPQLSSQQALTALGIGGQLGASGGGGLVNKNPSVTIGQPVVINLTNVTTLDGQVLDQRTKQITTNSINLAFDQFADSQLRN